MSGYAFLPVPYNAILRLLTSFEESGIVQRIKLPENTKVVTVHNDYETHEFLVMLESPGFAETVPGTVIPRLEFKNEVIQGYQIVPIEAVKNE